MPDRPANVTSRAQVSRGRPLRLGPVFFAVLLFLGVYFLLGRLEPRAGWLEVETPRTAVVGELLEIRITLGALPEAVRLGCDLNWSGKDRKRGGMLASGGLYPTVKEAGTTVFRIPVGEKEAMAFVSGIIFLTPSGRWEDSLRAAYTELIPVKPRGAAPPLSWKKLKVYPSPKSRIAPSAGGDAGGEKRESRFRIVRPGVGRTVVAAILFAGAGLCALNFALGRQPRQKPERAPRSKAWLGLGAGLAAGVLIEMTGIQAYFTGWGRKVAGELGLYYFRRSFQRPLAAGIAAAGMLILFVILKGWKKGRIEAGFLLAGSGLAVYLLAVLVSTLSYHPVDALRGFSFLGVSLISLTRACGAALALAGTLAGFLRAKARPPV